MSEMVIAEGVELELRPARLASRFAAFLLDALVQLLIFVFLNVLLNLDSSANDDSLSALSILSIVVTVIGYPVLCETLSTGRSLGKAAAGLRVVRVDGGPERFRHALVRALAGIFADVGVFSFGLAGALVSVGSAQGRRIGDLLAGTMVIRERMVVGRGSVPLPPNQILAQWAYGASVQKVPAGLIVASRQMISRIYSMDRQAAASLANELAQQTSRYVSPPPPPGTLAYPYLVAVTGERFRREAGSAFSGNRMR
ncbi:MAG TPA: RDD family protein [Actinocrinis sp.]|nr:RDD family protein [Actinocrinis sp.]